MTEFVEGPIHEIRPWKDGKGVTIKLHDDESTYYYLGKPNFPMGQACRFEIIQGTGEHKREWEILNGKQLETNPQVTLPPEAQSLPQLPSNAPQLIQMPVQSLKEIMESKSALTEAKVRALDAAVKTYDAMHRVDPDPLAVARMVIAIAKEYEGYL